MVRVPCGRDGLIMGRPMLPGGPTGRARCTTSGHDGSGLAPGTGDYDGVTHQVERVGSSKTADRARLRAHGLITRIPHSHRYQLANVGLHHAMLLSHVHTRLLLPALAQLTDPDPPAPSQLRIAARNYRHALDQLTQQAGLAA